MRLPALLLLAGAAQAAPAPILLVVTPPRDIVSQQVVGSPPVPTSFTYQLSATRSWTDWRLGAARPSWVCANSLSGRTPATLVLTICGAQPPGTYTGSVPVVASANTVTIAVTLTVTAPPPPVANRCLDDAGGVLTTDTGDPLTC
jgi:hypothetical protein